jgi:SAM-dependent methyltransferase
MKRGCLVCGWPLVRSGPSYDVWDRRLGVSGHFTFLECPNCLTWSLFPAPGDEELGRLYERHYNREDGSFLGYRRARSIFFHPLFSTLWSLPTGDVSFLRRGGRGRMLDYGCNEGRNLSAHRAHGWDIDGYETNPIAAAFARRRGFVVFEGSADTIPSDTYDVVVLSNVLEHSTAPRTLLASVRRVLRDDGEVWITTPNSASWVRVALGDRWINWHPPFHMAVFSMRALTMLLEESGFRVFQVQTFSPALWLAQSFIVRSFSHIGRPSAKLGSAVLTLVLTAGALAGTPCARFLDRGGRGDCIRVRASARERGTPRILPGEPTRP